MNLTKFYLRGTLRYDLRRWIAIDIKQKEICSDPTEDGCLRKLSGYCVRHFREKPFRLNFSKDNGCYNFSVYVRGKT